MAYLARRPVRSPSHDVLSSGRLVFLTVIFGIAGLVLIGRFFQLQVLEGKTWQLLAWDQHEVSASLVPRRGTIYVRDLYDGHLYPVAKDRDAWEVYAVPRDMKAEERESIATDLSSLLGLPKEDLIKRFSATSSAYASLSKDVAFEKIEEIRAKGWRSIGITKGPARFYPETGLGGQVWGYVTTNDENQRVGYYGIEGYHQSLLAGEYGSLVTEKDAAGRRLTVGAITLKEAKNGSDLVLTIDRSIQRMACEKAEEAVRRYDAEASTIIVMDPETGAIQAMCSFPDFDPAHVRDISSVAVLNNPATFYQYEPGSIFKAMTIAAGIEAGKISPMSTYVDTGEEVIDGFHIHNSDLKAHGVQTMTQVLSESLNTGTIHIQRLIGPEYFREFVQRFGFGEKTGLELNSETRGDISQLSRKGKVFAATASFGQGVTVTPLQMVAAFSAIGNGGKLMKPYIVDEIIRPDGAQISTKPQVVREVISSRTSRLVTGMLVDVVENGHGKHAGVDGYYVAGKTGTAQVPKPNGKGYLDNTITIGSFVGYAPADHPKFAMLVKVDKPKTVQFAESSAAPIFGEMAKFLLTYYRIPPERPLKHKDPPVEATVAPSTSGIKLAPKVVSTSSAPLSRP